MYKYVLVLLTILGAWSCQSSPQFPSGASYIHHIKNEGILPQTGDVVTYHLVHRNANDSLLYSTYKKGIPRKMKIPVLTKEEPISDLTEALLLMSEGDSLTFRLKKEYLPEQYQSAMTEDDEWIFDVKLLDILSEKEKENKRKETQAKGESIKKVMKNFIQQLDSVAFDTIIDASSLHYVKKGQGEKVAKGESLSIHYQTYILPEDTAPYTNTYSNAKPTRLVVGEKGVIPAWEIILPHLRRGDEVIMRVPPKNGLGATQTADWLIYLEVVE